MKPINLHTSVAQVNENLVRLNDSLGVRRAFSTPFVDGAGMDEHIKTVGAAADQHGGLMKVLISSYHHEKGKGWGSGEGETVGHPVEKLNTTLIPKDFAPAIKVIGAVRTLVTKAASIVGDKDPAITRARSQLGLLSAANGAQMNLFDFDSFMQFIVFPVIQSVSRVHSRVKMAHVGDHEHNVQLTPARHGMPQPSDEENDEEEQPESEANNPQAGAPANTPQGTVPPANSAPPAGAPPAGAPPTSGLSSPGAVVQALQNKQGQ
jgi:hypothetical protein